MFAFFSFFYAYARPFIKWFLRHFTRLCELQRICYGCESGAPRKKAIEKSLTLTRLIKIKEVINQLNDSVEKNVIAKEFYEQQIPYAVSVILKVKRVKPKIHPDFGPNLKVCMESIWSYRRLLYEIEEIRAIPFDSKNAIHETKLLKLWELLMPTEPLESRITKQWQNIGFQGDDPATDFRGEINFYFFFCHVANVLMTQFVKKMYFYRDGFAWFGKSSLLCRRVYIGCTTRSLAFFSSGSWLHICHCRYKSHIDGIQSASRGFSQNTFVQFENESVECKALSSFVLLFILRI